jgi:uncharacterized membrane protein YhaH (DUF805 family)
MQTTNPYQAPRTTSQPPAGSSANLSVKQILFSFSGRIPRRTYWLWAILLSVGFGVLAGLVGALLVPSDGSAEGPGAAAMLGFGLIYLLVLWVSLALQIKRWHDRGKSGAWVLINLVPLVGAVWSFVECGCLRGTFGPNNYGEDPT